MVVRVFFFRGGGGSCELCFDFGLVGLEVMKVTETVVVFSFVGGGRKVGKVVGFVFFWMSFTWNSKQPVFNGFLVISTYDRGVV